MLLIFLCNTFFSSSNKLFLTFIGKLQTAD